MKKQKNGWADALFTVLFVIILALAAVGQILVEIRTPASERNHPKVPSSW